MEAKLDNLNELTKVLSVKEQAEEQLLIAMQTWGIGKIIRSLKFEKLQGYTLASLFISLIIIRLWGKTIGNATSDHFKGLCKVSRNTFYRALLNPRIDWRLFLTKIALRFHAILREHQVDTSKNETCAILDGRLRESSGTTKYWIPRILGNHERLTHAVYQNSKPCLAGTKCTKATRQFFQSFLSFLPPLSLLFFSYIPSLLSHSSLQSRLISFFNHYPLSRGMPRPYILFVAFPPLPVSLHDCGLKGQRALYEWATPRDKRSLLK